MVSLIARHSGESRTAEAGCRSEHSRSEWPDGHATGVACNPAFSYAVIPAEAGIHFGLASFLEVQCFHSPCGRAGNFLCLCKESNQRNTPRGGAPSGHPALQVRERTPGFAECTSLCIQRTRAHRARAPAGCSCVRSPRHTGPRLGGILPQKQQLALLARPSPCCSECRVSAARVAMLGTANGAVCCTAAIHPWTALLRVVWDGARLLVAFALCSCFCGRMPPNGAPCGAASGRRKSPQGRAQDAREFAECTRMCIQRTPEHDRAPGGQDARKARHRGCVSLVTFFAQALRRRSGANSEAGGSAA